MLAVTAWPRHGQTSHILPRVHKPCKKLWARSVSQAVGCTAVLRVCARGCSRYIAARSQSQANLKAAEDAKVIFCILARGSSSKDSWPKTPQGVKELGNTRDDIARSLVAALGNGSSEAAVVLVFEDTPQTPSRHWWVLTSQFLQGQVMTEYSVLHQCQQLAQSIHDKQRTSRPSGCVLIPSKTSCTMGMQKTAEAFFEALGSPENSILVLLDETFPPLPVTAPDCDGIPAARRVVFLLGLREELNAEQLECFERAAVERHWSVLRLSLGWVGEFTSKVVARLQVLHSCGQLLPSLGILNFWNQKGNFDWSMAGIGWPCPVCREPELFLREGPLIHFFLPVQAALSELSCDPTSASAAACSSVARSCIAGLWRAHHAWDRCRLSFAFADGSVVTLTRRFKGRFQGRRATEYSILKELRGLVDAALAERSAKGRRAKSLTPGRRACTVQVPENGRLSELPYRRDGTLELHLEVSATSSDASLSSEKFASELLHTLWTPPGGKNAPSCMVCLVLFTSPPFNFTAGWKAVASSQLCHTDHFAMLCALQSALLGAEGSGAELLTQVLVPISPVLPLAASHNRSPSPFKKALQHILKLLFARVRFPRRDSNQKLCDGFCVCLWRKHVLHWGWSRSWVFLQYVKFPGAVSERGPIKGP